MLDASKTHYSYVSLIASPQRLLKLRLVLGCKRGGSATVVGRCHQFIDPWRRT